MRHSRQGVRGRLQAGMLLLGMLALAPASRATPLHQAVRAHDAVTLSELLGTAGTDQLNATIAGGITPLHMAAATRQPELLSLLIKHGAIIDQPSEGGFTALHWAALKDAQSCARQLIDHGGSIDATANRGITPLHLAASRQALNVLQLLIRRGANGDATTALGYTPLHMAVRANPHGLTAMLLAEQLATSRLTEEETELPPEATDLPDGTLAVSPATTTTNTPGPPLPVDEMPVAVPGTLLTVPLGLGEALSFVWIESLGIWFGKYEITNSQYKRFNRHHSSRSNEGFNMDAPDQPVVYVNWHNAADFAAWLTHHFSSRIPSGHRFRLPTDDEWVLVASNGGIRRYPWGDQWPPLYGNYSDQAAKDALSSWRGISGYNDGFPVTAPVQDSGMSEMGIFGLGGNVWEWMDDWYDATSTTKSRRGGSWDFDSQRELEVGARGFDTPASTYDTIGFRLVVGPALSPALSAAGEATATPTPKAPSTSLFESLRWRR
jgi:hypothetical protein